MGTVEQDEWERRGHELDRLGESRGSGEEAEVAFLQVEGEFSSSLSLFVCCC